MRTIILALAVFGVAAPAHAWGPAGHRWATSVAFEVLPPELPAFLRTPAARALASETANEPDNTRQSGKTHDSERDAAHFLDLTDDGKVLGVLDPSALPETRQEYDAALNAGGTDQYKAGYLPYAMIDGYQQATKNFALWRAARYGETKSASKQDRAWFGAERVRREAFIIHDLGLWSHYIADTTQVHHTTVHYDGWGAYPNPKNFPNTRFHVRWENFFVSGTVSRAAILAGAPAFHDCACPLSQRVSSYILENFRLVEPLYELEARGAFAWPTPDKNAPVIKEGTAFATRQLSRASGEIRDLIVLAWRDSGKGLVGYPGTPVTDIESGKVPLTRQMLGGE